MKELFYFSFSKLLIRVEYNKGGNMLQYHSHRELSFGERVVVDQYLLCNFAVKTDYYNVQPATFVYRGKDEALVKELNLFELKNAIKSLASKDKEIKKEVDNLVSTSLSNYYFEQIGNEIISLRKYINNEMDKDAILETKDKMNELIRAFNLYSQKKVTLKEVIPKDLFNRLKLIDFNLVN